MNGSRVESVLLTGGAGYIGSVLVGSLLQRDYQVTVLDNLQHGHPSLLAYCSHSRFDFVRGDVRDEQLVRSLVASHDAILPLAAVVGQSACDRDPLLARSVNVDAIALLAGVRSPEQKVVFPCTNSGYGTRSGQVYCTEETPLEPISLYGITKTEGERILRETPNTVVLRLATVFGPSPRMRLDLLVNDFVYKAATDRSLLIYEKNFKRNYVHIKDVADCFCFCLERFDEVKDDVFNVGLNDANLSKAELAEAIKKHVPDLHVHYAEVEADPDRRNYVVSNDKINGRGFVASRSLDDGIRQLLTAYQMLPFTAFRNA